MKKVFISVLIFGLLFTIGCKVNLKIPGVVDELYYEEIFTFELEDYDFYLDLSESHVKDMKHYGRIDTAEQAALIAEEIFLSGSDEKEVYEYKPFTILYDAKNTAWLVDSSCYVFHQKYGEQLGGGESVILDEETGEVLANWVND